MKKVRFDGVRPMGTIRPRRMWRPGDVLKVEDDVAKELAQSPEFRMIRGPTKKKTEKEKAEEA